MVDFYRGWMVKAEPIDDQFHFMCYSPVGERLTDGCLHPTDLAALRAAFASIDRFLTCSMLRTFLREAFETGQLEFGEWEKLNQSLGAMARV